MSPHATDNRISYLDGLRGVAILLVVLFHYCQLYASSGNYAYSTAFAELPVIAMGHCGVPLFFMISGFVILMTLEKCQNAMEFLRRRWLRLFPSLFIVSVILLIAGQIIPHYPFSKSIASGLAGLTFIDPVLLNKFFNLKVAMLDGSFWSLFVEMQFYLLMAGLYFIAKERTTYLFLLLSCLFHALPILFSNIVSHQSWDLINRIFISGHLPWFAVGMATYQYSVTRHKTQAFILILLSIGFTLAQGGMLTWLGLRLGLLAVWLAPLFSSKAQQALSHPWLLFIGGVSYPLYLIHQSLGVALLNAIKEYPLGGWCVLEPFLLTAAMLGLAWVIMTYGEKPLSGWLKAKVLPSPKP